VTPSRWTWTSRFYPEGVSQEGDALFQHVARFVRGRVPPEHELVVIQLVAHTVAFVMTTPEFLNKLTVVEELRHDNWQLRQALIAYQRDEMSRMERARKRKVGAAKKAAPKRVAKKVAPKRATPNAAFKRGAAGR
jgi:hypothetical protein